MARQPKRAKSFSFDLLSDWTPYATALGEEDERQGWVLHGTATLNGNTGALAFRGGWYGIKHQGAAVTELGMWERIDVSQAIQFKAAPGWEHAPRFAPDPPMSNSKHIDREEYWKPVAPIESS